MKLEGVAAALGLEIAAGSESLSREVTGGYCSDLLSDVMARAKPGDLWITVQGHQNVVAVAVLTGIAGVIVCAGVTPEPETLERANREGVPILRTSMGAFEVAGKVYAKLCGPV